MIKKYFNIKYVLYLGIPLILLVLIFIKVGRIAQQQRYDGIRINMAGRQRMLIQKMSKEVFLYSMGKIPKAQIKKTQKTFEMTLRALADGGNVPLGLKFQDFLKIPAMNNPSTKKQLDLVLKMNKVFKRHISNYLLTRNPESMGYIMQADLHIQHEMDKAVVMMQKTSEKNSFIMGLVLVVAVIIMFSSIALILHDKIRRMKQEVARLKKLEKILPICAHCKKIRIDKDPYKPSSWMSIEEHISKNEEVLLSHGVCPECLEKQYAELDSYESLNKN